eukprot:m.71636 g.71636  ORF g.71636 m.71636 type:complete len:114 (+) comp50194_c0_seq2:455-796(+)
MPSSVTLNCLACSFKPVASDPMAEIRAHTDFSQYLRAFTGTPEQRYYLELMTIALAKNPSYSVAQKHEAMRKTIGLMARQRNEQPPPVEHLIGFPKPSQKELDKANFKPAKKR